jgi:hypothetical protein
MELIFEQKRKCGTIRYYPICDRAKIIVFELMNRTAIEKKQLDALIQIFKIKLISEVENG